MLASGGVSTTTIGLIVVPIAIFLVGLAVAAIRGAIRFAQYMVRSEEAQSSIAKSNQNISDKLDGFMTEARTTLKEHDGRISFLEYAQNFSRRHASPKDEGNA